MLPANPANQNYSHVQLSRGAQLWHALPPAPSLVGGYRRACQRRRRNAKAGRPIAKCGGAMRRHAGLWGPKPNSISILEVYSMCIKLLATCGFTCSTKSSSFNMSTTITDPAVISSYNRGPLTTTFTPPSTCLSTMTYFGGSMYFGHAGNLFYDSACYPSSISSSVTGHTNGNWNQYYCKYP